MAQPSRRMPYRPGAVSIFFVVQAGVVALAFWAWLLVLAFDSDKPTAVHVLAATGATTASLIGVVLGVRLAMQRTAAIRHAELRRLLADISWNAFAAAGNAANESKVVPFPTLPLEDS
ncbi:MAG: hypothetical protein WA890_08665 [Micromonospora sp.]